MLGMMSNGNKERGVLPRTAVMSEIYSMLTGGKTAPVGEIPPSANSRVDIAKEILAAFKADNAEALAAGLERFFVSIEEDEDDLFGDLERG